MKTATGICGLGLALILSSVFWAAPFDIATLVVGIVIFMLGAWEMDSAPDDDV